MRKTSEQQQQQHQPLEHLLQSMYLADDVDEGGDYEWRLGNLKADIEQRNVRTGAGATLRYPNSCPNRCELVDVLAVHCKDEGMIQTLLENVGGVMDDLEGNLWDAVLQAIVHENDALLKVMKQWYGDELNGVMVKEMAIDYLGKWGTSPAVIDRVMNVVDVGEGGWLRRLNNSAFANMNTRLVEHLIKKQQFMDE